MRRKIDNNHHAREARERSKTQLACAMERAESLEEDLERAMERADRAEERANQDRIQLEIAMKRMNDMEAELERARAENAEMATWFVLVKP